jgi:hypothetical protein
VNLWSVSAAVAVPVWRTSRELMACCDPASISIPTGLECNGIRWREPIVALWQLSMPKAGVHAIVIIFQACEVNMESKHTSCYSAGFEPERPASINENVFPGDPLHAMKTPGKSPGKQPPPIKPPGPERPPVKPPKPGDPPIQPPDPGKPPAEPPDPGRPPIEPPDDPSPIRAALRIGMGWMTRKDE